MAKRLIEMKRYRGAFVAPRNQWNYLDTDVLQWVLENDYDPRLISAMSEVRNLVELADCPLGSRARDFQRSGAD